MRGLMPVWLRLWGLCAYGVWCSSVVGILGALLIGVFCQ
jgi:hypothetical protein